MFLHGKGLKPGSEDDGERRPTTEGDKLREQKVSSASRTALLPPFFGTLETLFSRRSTLFWVLFSRPRTIAQEVRSISKKLADAKFTAT